MLKPPLKWAGGKRWLVAHLKPIWEANAKCRYVEPFCGGLAVVLGLQPKRALLNDINPHLINFYRHVQNGLEMQITTRNDEKLFYRHRERFNQLIGNGEAQSEQSAQLFYYLNRTCFNGLCRFNRAGDFNVPFGTYKAINYARDFSEYAEIFRRWKFSNRDVEALELRPDDFVYADPPYDVEFTTYSAGGFSWEDQVRTARFLANHAGPVVISNQATDRIVELYEGLGFELTYLDGPRRISCTGDRTSAREVLAIKL
ncbi:MAG TPA: Dam family site-specific DNA-(adenine-N6)-methyltransferase [Pyrinomonadaceae bacterium]|nr:Dam family site-specific DNA-(adenine-N6)-methyltransferase [Pyrinomonadaceae bacterium]